MMTPGRSAGTVAGAPDAPPYANQPVEEAAQVPFRGRLIPFDVLQPLAQHIAVKETFCGTDPNSCKQTQPSIPGKPPPK